MFLNETNPPLSEVVEHFGVRGMKWGQRKSTSASANALYRDGSSKKVKIATAVLAIGVGATLLAMNKHGAAKILTGVILDAPVKYGSTAKKIDTIIDGEVVMNQISNIRKGSSAMKVIGPGVWNTSMLAITKG